MKPSFTYKRFKPSFTYKRFMAYLKCVHDVSIEQRCIDCEDTIKARMSKMRSQREVRLLASKVPCPRCGAPVGINCSSRRNGPLNNPHVDRTRSVLSTTD